MDTQYIDQLYAAKIVGVSLEYLWKQAHRGYIPFYMVNGKGKFKREDLTGELCAEHRRLFVQEVRDRKRHRKTLSDLSASPPYPTHCHEHFEELNEDKIRTNYVPHHEDWGCLWEDV